MKLRELKSVSSKAVPGEQLRELRKELGSWMPLSQTETAEAFGISQSAWSRYENGEIPAGPIAKLFRLFRSEHFNKRD